jgi:maltose O-acetyltransferase
MRTPGTAAGDAAGDGAADCGASHDVLSFCKPSGYDARFMEMSRVLLILARKNVLAPIADAGACPLSLRLALLRLLGWKIGPGAQVYSARFLYGRVTVGERAMIGQEVFLDGHAPITIGREAWIRPRCTVITQTHNIGTSERRAAAGLVRKPVVISDGCWLGANVTVLPGVTIGRGCVIASGAVVTRDCKPDGLYAGVPAMRKRDLP